MKRIGKKTHQYWIIAGLVLFFIATIFINVWIRKEGFKDGINYMDGLDVIYWINLDRSKERKEKMLTVLDDSTFGDIPKIRIVANDGKTPEKVYKKLDDYEKQDSTTDSEYACLLSHMDAIRTFYDSGNDVALIFEDDITLEFKKYWKKSIKQITTDAPEDWDIIMLWYNVRPDGFNNEELKKYSGEDGSVSYLVSRNGATKLIKDSYKNGKYNLTSEFHHKSDVYIYSKLNTYVYKYPMFVFPTDNDSEIHQSHVELLHNVSKRNAISAFESEPQYSNKP
jgi:GR25 family glycosyltransferase involved in LPS biosynthesis